MITLVGRLSWVTVGSISACGQGRHSGCNMQSIRVVAREGTNVLYRGEAVFQITFRAEQKMLENSRFSVPGSKTYKSPKNAFHFEDHIRIRPYSSYL